MNNNKSFTLMELILVVVIVGILATLGLTHYGSYRESTYDRDAQVNLRLILQAERVSRMESNANPPQYLFPWQLNPPQPNTTAGINRTLNLTLPTNDPAWNYTLTSVAGGATFCAQATRNALPVRSWRIRSPTAAIPDPQPQAGNCP